MNDLTVMTIVASVLAVIALFLAYKFLLVLKKMGEYGPAEEFKKKVIAEELEFKKKVATEELELKKKVMAEELELKKKVEKNELEIENLKSSYADKKVTYDILVKEISIYEDKNELISVGYFEPKFEFGTSDKYAEALESVKKEQKLKIKQKTAVLSSGPGWTINNSAKQGEVMLNQYIKLTLRTFNQECGAAIAAVKWNNLAVMVKRIEKSAEMLTKLNSTYGIAVTPGYKNLKISELKLVNEMRLKKQQEREEQLEINKAIREEAQLERDMKIAIKSEQNLERAVDEAKRKADNAMGKTLENLKLKIASLETDLVKAQTKSERAKSMAQQTRAGVVYVISNPGSFGEDVYKIGMTRRLEPMDRVKELGDASVPFTFDVHAMIKSDDAPKLEKLLHNKFAHKRTNLVNMRKEFFNITIGELKHEVITEIPSCEFVETAAAAQYRETLTMRELAIEREFDQAILLPNSL